MTSADLYLSDFRGGGAYPHRTRNWNGGGEVVVKRLVVAVSFISVALGLPAHPPARGDVARPASAPRAPAASAVAVGVSFLIEPPMADYVRELDPREQREQIRDWAVLGTLARLGVTPQQLARATYQVPPARLPYLDELYAFEYGHGRRAYLGNRVLLFRDADDPDPQATIGRLADRVRMENDEMPKVVEIYLIDDQRDLGTIRIERAADVTRDALFSKAAGYITGEARDASQLSTWLEQVDDLTFAKITGDGRILLGGRRFAGTRTANITAEEVAAIYQAHQLLERRRVDALAKLKALPPILRDSISRYVELAGKQASSARADAAAETLDITLRMVPPAQRARVLRTLDVVLAGDRSPGFSLDPEWLPDPDHPEHPLMLARLRAFVADPCADLERTVQRAGVLARQEPDESRRTSSTVAAADVRALVLASGITKLAAHDCEKLKNLVSPVLKKIVPAFDKVTPGSWDRAMSLYYEFVGALEQQIAKQRDTDKAHATLGDLAISNLTFHEEDTRVQCARYEGVAGTRVGMTLFYTDLLAKLWHSIDFGHSAPIVEVPGFLAGPHMDLPAVFEQEIRNTPYSRMWFGARSNSVSRSGRDKNTAFLFEHRFSRIYTASSNPAHPGFEMQPGERSRRTLGWWDRHFDEVADYEQEYHRQNQIMKWALVTAALSKGSLAEALGNAAVFRGFQFAGWQRSNRASLRFAETLPSVRQRLAGRECIPVLSSYAFQSFGQGRHFVVGGVSTVGRAAPRVVPLVDVTKPLGARTASVADLGAGTSGTAARARPVLNRRSVTFLDATLARVRGASGDISLGTPRVDYAQGPRRGALAIRAGQGQTAIGEVSTEIAKDHVAIRWSEGPIERTRLGKPEPGTETVENADKLAKQGFAVDAARVYERGLPPGTSEADTLAREAIIDIAHRRSGAVVAKLERLAAEGKQVSLEAREALVHCVRRESEPVARRFEAALKGNTPLNDPGTSVVAERGRILLMREIEHLSRVPTPMAATGHVNSVLYIDTRLRVAQDGLLPETGSQIARWGYQRGVKLVELKADAIRALPDRFVETSTGLTVQRPPGPLPMSWSGLPPRVFLIQQCDADRKTTTTSDDC